MPTQNSILIVRSSETDDDGNPGILEILSVLDAELDARHDLEGALDTFENEPRDLVIGAWLSSEDILTLTEQLVYHPANPGLLYIIDPAQRTAAVDALDLGANAYMVEPVNSHELRLWARRAMRGNETGEGLSEDSATRQLMVDKFEAFADEGEELVLRLSSAAQIEGIEPIDHLQRVAQYARVLSDALGWSHERVQAIRLAAPMHDIGKIGLPAQLLLRENDLTQEQWERMKTHPMIGHEILSGSDNRILKMAAQIAAEHHERWDGEGYPNGLAGEDISVEARIVTLANAYDALRQDRVYREAWPVEKALDHIENERGGQFDPELVDIFLETHDEIDRIRDVYSGDNVPEHWQRSPSP